MENFRFHINHQEPSVLPLKIHLPDRDYIVFRDGGEQAAATATVSELDRYLSRPLDALLDDIQYCQYYKQFIVYKSAPSRTTSLARHCTCATHNEGVPQTKRRDLQNAHALSEHWRGVYLRLLLLHISPRSFEDARTVDGTVYDTLMVQSMSCSRPTYQRDRKRAVLQRGEGSKPLSGTTPVPAGDCDHGRCTSSADTGS